MLKSVIFNVKKCYLMLMNEINMVRESGCLNSEKCCVKTGLPISGIVRT